MADLSISPVHRAAAGTGKLLLNEFTALIKYMTDPILKGINKVFSL